MNKSPKSFILLSLLMVCTFVGILSGLGYIYKNSDLHTYEILLFIIILIIIILLLMFILLNIVLCYAYWRKSISYKLHWIYKFAVNTVFPPIMAFSSAANYKKDEIRRFYVELNNIIVNSCSKSYLPHEVLVLLPHCLQNSSCRIKITNDIGNCMECGKCCIGEIKKEADKNGVKVYVATGGTLARNIVNENKPRLILSVACERDLSSGIADVRIIPVIGIINKRPYGPCKDTTIDIEVFKQKFDEVLIKE